MFYLNNLWARIHKPPSGRKRLDPTLPPHIAAVPLEKVDLSLIDSVALLVLNSHTKVEEDHRKVYHFWHHGALHARMLTEENAQGISTEYCLVAIRRDQEHDPVLYFQRHHAAQGFVLDTVRMRNGLWENEVVEAAHAWRNSAAGKHRKLDRTVLPSAALRS